MRFNLGKLILAPAILAAAALASNTAMAETVKVPFSFTAAGKVWPAGEYSVQKGIAGTTVTLKSKETSLSFASLLGPGEPDPTDQHITLRFDEGAGTHTLRSIQYGSQITSRLDRGTDRTEHMASSGR